MWTDSGHTRREARDDQRPRRPLHNIDEALAHRQQSASQEPQSPTEREEYESPVDARPYSGTWGERDVGGPLDQRLAMEDYESLRRELTTLSKTRSKSSQKASSLRRRASRTKSARSARSTADTALEDGEAEGHDEDHEDFQLDEFMREGHFEKRKDGHSAKKVGVVFKDLTVKGVGSSAIFVKTLPDAVIGTFGPDLYRLVTRFFPFLSISKAPNTRTLINNFTGVVRDGEMMLVLGRPGAGCSTFLKVIANNRDEFASVSGTVSYGGIDAARQRKEFRGEVNYNPEDDVHFPELNVFQTFVFALLNKTKKREKNEIPIIADALMRMFGIPHTKYTKVGNEFVRGVSGGERKRVSIAETLATKSTVLCWDNSTRGLDASTALDYAKSLRIMTDVSDKTTLTTLYQAGEGIYDVMDKVLVIDQGRCIYQGPARNAREYFVNLGFFCPERQTTADFLTACTDPVERRFREGWEARTPKTAEELEKAFHESQDYRRVLQEVEDYEKELAESNYADAREFEATVQESKSHKTVSKHSSYTVSYPRQILACARREFWLLTGDTETLYTKAFIIIANGLIVGSLFYNQPTDSEGTFSRGGTLFFGILFLGWLQLSELMKAVTGRQVVQRQKDYAFYRPSAVSLARVLVDFPVLFPQVAAFTIIMYFLTNLERTASQFFINILFVYTTTICVTSLYRMFAALSPTIDDAVRFSGIALNVLVIFTGYVIPKPQLVDKYIWFGWLYYINPLSYAFEAVLSNEFASREIACAPQQLVPQGPGVNPANQGCSLVGAGVNQKVISGADYIGTNYTYTRHHLWRNFGVVIAFTVLYILITVIAVETFNFSKTGGGALMFKKSKKAKQMVKASSPDALDEEATITKKVNSSASSDQGRDPEKPLSKEVSDSNDESTGDKEIGVANGNGRTANNETGTANGFDKEIGGTDDNPATFAEQRALQNITDSKSVFTWEDVRYSVPYQGGQKQLLNDVDGYAKPGVMVALMGASGAGKTTLLNTLAQRQRLGVVSGDMMVDGRALPRDFQRSTGFCEQSDVHDGTATIREALEFSALLRQARSTPRAEKLAYVEQVIELLELEDIQDAVISSLGVEQRKRLTIGVELAAKPSLLLFLDEPTSGLDSQSAFSIVRFLKKLARAGQAILCTIHQPSSVLIQEFDMILALNPGGNTFYFGPVGDNGSAVIKYFSDRGFDCPHGKNVAEFILEMAAKPRRRPDGTKVNWNEEWKNSENAKELKNEIAHLKQERAKTEAPDVKDVHEYAAPVWDQSLLLTQRTFRQHWRDPSYLYGKLFVAVIVGIFNGFTFYQLGNSTQDMTNRMFSAFLILTIPPTIVNAVVPKFFQNMIIWQTRELPSRIYGWFAFCTAQVVCEIPIAVIQSVLYFLLWYFPAGLPYKSSVSGYVFFMTLLFHFFQASWGQWITAFAPNFTVIANTLPFFFVMVALFNGVVRPYSMLPNFWKYWMYYVNPATWWIRGVLSATLNGIPVVCTSDETAKFTPPSGQTCAQYAGAFARQAGGYLVNPNSTGVCEYCEYSKGNQFLSTINIKGNEKWRDLGIFIVYVIANWALVYFFIYTIRIRGFGFGFGYIFGTLGKIAGFITAPIHKYIDRRRARKDAQQSVVQN